MADDYLAKVAEAEASAAVGDIADEGGVPRIRVVPAIVVEAELPALPPEAVCGIVRRGGKLLVSGASKAGKSYLLIELAVAVATGGWWVGFRCTLGRVLYLNLEIQEPQFMHRVYRVYDRMGADPGQVRGNFDVANLRGKFRDICDLVDSMLATFRPGDYDLVILDPAYKVQPGSENDADAITAFCAELDRLAEGLGCTIAYTHHHSKGAQGMKAVEDRASGSGVFARDADALVDMCELEWDEDVQETRNVMHWHDAVPFRLEFVLRDFRAPKPRDVWFRYPVHEVDATGMLEGSSPKRQGGRARNAELARRAQTALDRQLDEFMGERDEVDRKDFVKAVGRDKRTVDKYLKQSTLFEVESGPSSAVIRRVGSRVGSGGGCDG